MRSVLILAVCLVLATAGPARAADLGTLDPSFGTDGIARYSIPNGYIATALALQPDRKLVIAGGLYDTDAEFPDLGVAVLRVLPDGALDPSFATGGVFTLFDRSITSNPRGLVVQPDGKIVVVGDRFDLIRLTAEGTLDPTFGTNGRRQIPLSFGAATSSAALVVQPDGKLVMAGYAETVPNEIDVAVIRVDEHGELDGSFGTGGVVTTNFPRETGGSGFEIGSSMVLQPDGKIVVAGSILARYLTDGRLDPTFANGDLRNRYGLIIGDLVLDVDGTLLAACDVPSDGEDLGLCRFDGGGDLDPAFGSGGMVALTTLSGGTLTGGGFAKIALQPDRRILLTAFADHRATVLRLDRDGRLDTAFGAGGVGERFPVSAVFNGVAWQPDAGIVTAGIADFPFTAARWVGSTCGNGIRDADEACDDGNRDEADGCDTTCRSTVCGATVCGPCETCSAAGTCVAAPRPSCRVASAATLRLAAASGPAGRHLRWQWRGTGGLPDPTTPRSYTFCAYAGDGPDLRTLLALTVPAECDQASCWRRSTARHVFQDRDAASAVTRLGLRVERRGDHSIALRAGGPALTVPPLPIAPPIVTQLVAADRCWEARFEHPRMDARRLRAAY